MIALSLCGCGYETTKTARLVSPDGTYAIELERSDPGACCSVWDKGRIVGEKEPFLDLDAKLFEVSRAYLIQVSWIAADDIHIKVCDASQIHYRTKHSSRTTGRTILVTLENIVADSIAECGFRSSYYNGP